MCQLLLLLHSHQIPAIETIKQLQQIIIYHWVWKWFNLLDLSYSNSFPQISKSAISNFWSMWVMSKNIWRKQDLIAWELKLLKSLLIIVISLSNPYCYSYTPLFGNVFFHISNIYRDHHDFQWKHRLWLVVSTPVKNTKVSSDSSSQLNGKKSCSKAPTSDISPHFWHPVPGPATKGHAAGPQHGQQCQQRWALEEALIAVAVQHKAAQPGGRALADAHPATPGLMGPGWASGERDANMHMGNSMFFFCGMNWRNLWYLWDVDFTFCGKIRGNLWGNSSLLGNNVGICGRRCGKSTPLVLEKMWHHLPCFHCLRFGDQIAWR